MTVMMLWYGQYDSTLVVFFYGHHVVFFNGHLVVFLCAMTALLPTDFDKSFLLELSECCMTSCSKCRHPLAILSFDALTQVFGVCCINLDTSWQLLHLWIWRILCRPWFVKLPSGSVWKLASKRLASKGWNVENFPKKFWMEFWWNFWYPLLGNVRNFSLWGFFLTKVVIPRGDEFVGEFCDLSGPEKNSDLHLQLLQARRLTVRR